MPFTLEQLEFLRGILSGVVKEASQATKGQRLAAIQSHEVLLQAIHDVSTELSGVVGVLIKKGLVTSPELEQQERENAAQLEVEKARAARTGSCRSFRGSRRFSVPISR